MRFNFITNQCSQKQNVQIKQVNNISASGKKIFQINL